MMTNAALIGYGPCFLCGRPFTFNPNWVPSVPIDPLTGQPPDVDTHADGLEAATARAVKHPLCAGCVNDVNAERAQRGQRSIYVSPHAYESTDSL
jgi:hypothetical protein